MLLPRGSGWPSRRRCTGRCFARSGAATSRWPSRFPIGGAARAQQDLYDVLGQTRTLLYSGGMWDRLGDHSAYDDLEIGGDRFRRWHPLNQSLYVGYKVMLTGMLIDLQGGPDRDTSSESRGRIRSSRQPCHLRKDRPRVQAAWADRQVAHHDQVAARILPPSSSNRPNTMFRVILSRTLLSGAIAARLDGPFLSLDPLRESGDFDPQLVARARSAGGVVPPDRRPAARSRHEPDQRDRDPALAPHLLRRKPVRPADVAPPAPLPGGGSHLHGPSLADLPVAAHAVDRRPSTTTRGSVASPHPIPDPSLR